VPQQKEYLNNSFLQIFKFSEIELLIVFREKLTEEKPIPEIFLEVRDLLRKLDFIIQPCENQLAHILCLILILLFFFLLIFVI